MNIVGVSGTYAVNDSTGRDINRYLLSTHHQLARAVSSSLSMSMNLKSKKTDYKSDKATPQELKEVNRNPNDYVDFSVPYNLAVN